MKKNMILLAVLIALFLGSGYILQGIYGDSYKFPPSEDSWRPDGSGGWEKHGNPSEPQPEGESILPPLITYYLPFLIPAFVLVLFLFTPLGRLLEEKKEGETTEDMYDS